MRSVEATDFGVLLRRYRLAAGLTQEALAEQAGLSARGLQELERGGHRPLEDTVRRLTAALSLVGADRAAFRQAGAPQPDRRALQGARDAARQQLPVEVTSFIGRERELEMVSRLVGTTRLLTLTGPAGVGKTRLAQRLATTLAPEFAGGVFFVSLAELTDPALVLPAVARVFGVQPGRRELGEVLAELLRPRHLLLLLDNCEQVAAAAPALGALLARCPHLTLLATSRAPLQVAAEQVFSVPPLDLPPTVLPSLEALAQIEAVTLFLARARAVKADFALTTDNAVAVTGICRALDGLPLALELAAARVRLLPPAALLARLAHRLAVLTAGPADLPARQRTLRATLTWSHDLLRPAEQALFRRLGVCAGGCTLAMAEEVANGADPLDVDLLEGLDALVRHSLLIQEEADGEPRFGMLETVREFALAQLSTAGEEAATRQAHANTMVRLLDVDSPLRRPGSLLAVPLPLLRLDRERENLRLALGWCAERGDAERGLRLVTRCFQLWWNLGPLAEGLGWLRRFLALTPADAPLPLPAPLRLTAHRVGASLAGAMGEQASATAFLVEALALAEALHDDEAVASILWLSGDAALAAGDLDAAEATIRRGLVLARQGGWTDPEIRAVMRLGIVAYRRGDLAAATSAYEEAYASSRAEPYTRQWPGRVLGYLALAVGDQPAAARRFRESLDDTWSQHLDAATLENLRAFAALAREQAQWERAARLLGAADAGQERRGGVLGEPIGRQEGERTLAAAQEHLGEPAYAAAYAAGRELSPEQAVQEALTE